MLWHPPDPPHAPCNLRRPTHQDMHQRTRLHGETACKLRTATHQDVRQIGGDHLPRGEQLWARHQGCGADAGRALQEDRMAVGLGRLHAPTQEAGLGGWGLHRRGKPQASGWVGGELGMDSLSEDLVLGGRFRDIGSRHTGTRGAVHPHACAPHFAPPLFHQVNPHDMVG